MTIGFTIIRRLFQITYYFYKHFSAFLVSHILKCLSIKKIVHKYPLFADISKAERIRFFLQDIGGAPIKLAQIMAMRPDFLPDDYIEQLLKLLDEVPIFSPRLSKQIIEEELNSDIPTLFSSFTEEPIAAASFGQVHTATLHSGEEVILKVQRPGLQKLIAADIKILQLATFFIDLSGLTNRTLLKPVFDDFSEWTRDELDYRIEGSHIQQIYEKAKDASIQKIPKVYWNYTSRRVLTMERLRGIWMKDIIKGLKSNRESIEEELSGYNTSLLEISNNTFRNTLCQIFTYGVYHADPHAANLMVMENGVIGYVDFGITGKLPEKAKELQVKLHEGLESGDFDQFYASVIALLAPPYHADLVYFKNFTRRSYKTWLNAQYMGNANIQEKSFARLMIWLTYGANQSGVAFNTLEVRVYRTLAIVDALLLQFAPTLDVRSELRKFFKDYRIRRILHYDIPTVIHKIPSALEAITDHLDEDIMDFSTRISKVRTFLAKTFKVLTFLLIGASFLALFAHETTGDWLKKLSISQFQAAMIALFAIIFFGWLSRMFHLRSVVQDYVPLLKKEKSEKKR